MSDSIWTATLANFRDRVAGIEPVPAGVSSGRGQRDARARPAHQGSGNREQAQRFRGRSRPGERAAGRCARQIPDAVAACRRRYRGVPANTWMPAAEAAAGCRNPPSYRGALNVAQHCRIGPGALRKSEPAWFTPSWRRDLDTAAALLTGQPFDSTSADGRVQSPTTMPERRSPTGVK